MEDVLGSVLKAFDGQRKELQAQLKDLDAKETAVRQALTDKSSIDRGPSIPDDKYAEVLSYLRKHPDSRQADMAKDLKLNSGIISSAMRRGLQQQEVAVDKPGRGGRYTLVEEK